MSISAVVLAVTGLLAGSTTSASADVFNMPGSQKSLEFVTVGDPGNTADRFGYGQVDYTYQMGRYDVTAAQYTQFLNAVAATDTYYLYHIHMPSTGSLHKGCGIIQSGDPGSYTYSVVAGRENFPVNFVSWGDAARFANWLSNGQPTGPQGPGTTETGSYTLKGAMSSTDLLAVTRNLGARYVIPSEDEWYKAAYYKGGSIDAGYWFYPTRSNTTPSNALSPAGTNNANFMLADREYADPTNFLTPVGFFAGSPGPYGTFDMGGNVNQWNEGIVDSFYRCYRGGSFNDYNGPLEAWYRGSDVPEAGNNFCGFRIALVPEPATLCLLAFGGLLLARQRRIRSPCSSTYE
jgi:sulfatase modifying factor 1